MKNWLIIFAVIGFVSCKVTPTATETNTEVKKSNLKTVVAKVYLQTYENKAGRVINGVDDYFLVYEGENWFIRFLSSPVPPSAVKPYVDSTVTCEVMEMEGLWDTDDPNVQSRVGKYVVLHSIKPYR